MLHNPSGDDCILGDPDPNIHHEIHEKSHDQVVDEGEVGLHSMKLT